MSRSFVCILLTYTLLFIHPLSRSFFLSPFSFLYSRFPVLLLVEATLVAQAAARHIGRVAARIERAHRPWRHPHGRAIPPHAAGIDIEPEQNLSGGTIQARHNLDRPCGKLEVECDGMPVDHHQRILHAVAQDHVVDVPDLGPRLLLVEAAKEEVYVPR